MCGGGLPELAVSPALNLCHPLCLAICMPRLLQVAERLATSSIGFGNPVR
jgi:hypothetical protein